MARTTRSSMSVKPPPASRLLVADDATGTSALRLAAGSARAELEGAALTRRAIDVGALPGIARHVREHRPRAVGAGGRTAGKRLEPLAGGGVGMVLEIVEIEDVGEVLHLEQDRVLARATQIIKDARRHQAGEKAEDDEDDEELDEREAALAPALSALRFRRMLPLGTLKRGARQFPSSCAKACSGGAE